MECRGGRTFKSLAPIFGDSKAELKERELHLQLSPYSLAIYQVHEQFLFGVSRFGGRAGLWACVPRRGNLRNILG